METQTPPASYEEESASAAPRETPSSETDDAPGEHRLFPIIGIGASAGGLEALETFLRNVPAGSGMAFVIIQHLDPTHKDILVQLLERSSAMPVAQVKDRMRVEPDHVYVLPPNKDMSILHGVLHLFAPAAPRGQRMPIDFFLRSLADDQEERSVGVILSGMGSDGTLGLRAIKGKGGGGFVQAPASAAFDGMPRSAMDAGLADVVAAVEELPGRIVAYLQHVPFISEPDAPLESKVQSALEKILIVIRTQTGHDFSLYKKSTIYRRIERRMGLHQISRIADYVRYLRENTQETELLFKELLIGVTSFFRDPVAWERLRDAAIPALLAARPAGGGLRAWTPGCSTGEEAYSLAIVFREALEQSGLAGKFALQIFATDLDREAIDKARQGIYPANIAADVSPERLQRFFVQDDRGYRVNQEIREMVVFAPQNMIMDPPFTRLDLLLCRNLLIYLVPELQKKLLGLFHYSLVPGGILFLGNSETVGTLTGLFAPLDGKVRLYRRLDSSLRAEPAEFSGAFPPALSAMPAAATVAPGAPRRGPNLQSLVEQLILQRYAPAAVLTSDKGDILYVSGRTGKYLEPAEGKANWNIFAMARRGLRYEIDNAFQKALRQKEAVTVQGLRVATNGDMQTLDLTVVPLKEPGALQGAMLVVFADVAMPPESGRPDVTHEASSEVTLLMQELQRTREELQSTREEMQTSQEELKSANEELQSTNEELQSTNEELTTSKEEMQSMNEELLTVNHELQAKIDELSRASNDMNNLLNSTDIAILFLDQALCVRRFTTQAARILRLIAGDVGRPITDIASRLIYPELAEDVQEVLRTLVFREKPVASNDGRRFRVRINPYRTLENMIDGVVVTFTDITASSILEADMRRTQAGLEKRIAEQAGEAEQADEGSRAEMQPGPGEKQ